ncbi:MAG: metal ABC transporter substrate-binding protein [Actinomycetes bacterium]
MRMIPKTVLSVICLLGLLPACSTPESESSTRPNIVVTYSVLGSVVVDLVGDAAEVTILIPDGQDPHDFQPSARDIEAINNADIVVSNGLDFEEGLEDVLASAIDSGVSVYMVGENITVREPEEDHAEEGHSHGAGDPHLWLSPMSFAQALPSLTAAINKATGLSIDETAALDQLTLLDNEIKEVIGSVSSCVLVSGHDELGYFADRYGCTVIGAIIPSFSTTSEATAMQIAELKVLAESNNVKAVFTGLGTPAEVSEQLASELGIAAVSLSTHYLNGATNYREFMLNLANQIAEALR